MQTSQLIQRRATSPFEFEIATAGTTTQTFAKQMKTQILIGLGAAISCLAMPFLSRIPRGGAWVAQYLPDEGHFISGLLLFLAFALIPAVIVFCTGLISKRPYYLPVMISTMVTLMMLGYWHHDNDLAAHPQAAITLLIIPIFAGALGMIGGLIGWGLQSRFRSPRIKG